MGDEAGQAEGSRALPVLDARTLGVVAMPVAAAEALLTVLAAVFAISNYFDMVTRYGAYQGFGGMRGVLLGNMLRLVLTDVLRLLAWALVAVTGWQLVRAEERARPWGVAAYVVWCLSILAGLSTFTGVVSVLLRGGLGAAIDAALGAILLYLVIQAERPDLRPES